MSFLSARDASADGSAAMFNAREGTQLGSLASVIGFAIFV